MIPKKEHLKQIERFHTLLEAVHKKIEYKGKDAGLEAFQQYFELTSKVWPMIDNYIEIIKNKLDEIDKFDVSEEESSNVRVIPIVPKEERMQLDEGKDLGKVEIRTKIPPAYLRFCSPEAQEDR